MASPPNLPDPLSSFWAPLCAIGSQGTSGRSAQICVAVAGASIVPDRPRITVTLWNYNYTHDLVAESGSLAVTLLSGEQLHLLEALGLVSGRERDKLRDTGFEADAAGNPWFPGGVARISADVIEAFDLGDATSFLCAVRERERFREEPPMTWYEARDRLPEEFHRRFAEKQARDQEAARRRMRWR